MFNRFWRAEESRARRSGGSGLGLSISIEDARLHGGWLQAWGEPGRGSAFRLTLPRDRRRAARRSSPLPLVPDDRAANEGVDAEPAPPSSTSDAAAGSVPTPVHGLPVIRGSASADRTRRAAARSGDGARAAGAAARPGRARGLRERARRARRCRCCAASATATRRSCRPARSTAAMRWTWFAASSTPPGAARTGTGPPAASSPPRPRSGTTAPASPCSPNSSTPSTPPRSIPRRTCAPCASAAPRWAGSPRVAGSRPPSRRSRST